MTTAADIQVAERPIPFSGEMVRAILDGRKSQTRRVAKLDPRMIEGEEADWCPYGQPGTMLWVRETHIIRAAGKAVIYKADLDAIEAAGVAGMYGGWKPSIHMPRWASRITLELLKVRVETVQDITEDDAKAEGVQLRVSGVDHCGGPLRTYRTGFVYTWQSLNQKRGFGWCENPWVWVLEFRRVKE